MENLVIPEHVRDEVRADNMQNEIEANFSPPGSLGLPALLESKRIKYGIPDSAFKNEPIFDNVYVWQVPLDESETWGKSNIIKTEVTKKRELQEAPRGVVVAAGLQALDQLRSYGVDIGHTIVFTHLAPFRLRLPMILGKEPVLVIVCARLISGSEDLNANLRSGKCKITARENAEGAMEHFYEDEAGYIWDPIHVETEQV